MLQPCIFTDNSVSNIRTFNDPPIGCTVSVAWFDTNMIWLRDRLSNCCIAEMHYAQSESCDLLCNEFSQNRVTFSAVSALTSPEHHPRQPPDLHTDSHQRYEYVEHRPGQSREWGKAAVVVPSSCTPLHSLFLEHCSLPLLPSLLTHCLLLHLSFPVCTYLNASLPPPLR